MAKRERGTGGLFKMKNSRMWYAQYYRDGRQHRVSTDTDIKQEAQAFLRKLLADADQGKAFVGDVKKIHYGDLRAGLIQNYIERGNKSLQTLADGTETIWGLTPLDEFFEYKSDQEPGVPVTKITTDAAREFTRKRQAEHVTNSTINTSLAALRRMLNIAREDGKIQIVPVIRLLKPNPARKGFIEREKFDHLLAEIPLHSKPLILLLYYCGVRVGEALQIEWPQVDLDKAVIRLEDEQTKSGEARTIPLPDILVELLRRQEPKTGLVFDDTDMRTIWPKACGAVGLSAGRDGGLIIHDLRRSAVRNMTKAGVPQNVAMKISGHRTNSIFQRYNIVDEQDIVEAMRRVEKFSETSVRLASTPKANRSLTP